MNAVALSLAPRARVHDLKCWPQFFNAIADGSKPFELRKDDRDFRVGDILHLREWIPLNAPRGPIGYTGRDVHRRVTYILDAELAGDWLPEGMVAMGLAPLNAGHPQTRAGHMPGLIKLAEECGELVTEIGKKLAFPEVDDHPDGKGPLRTRIEDEIADVIAAAAYVVRRNGLDWRRIADRAGRKMARFVTWGMT